MPDRDSFWFNRFVQYWTVPLRFDLVDLVSRARLQVVQTGTLGPQFYGLADDPTADRQWAGMPLVGVRENLEMFANPVQRLQEAGAKVVSQMSLAWHYGDQDKRTGLWDSWERIWTDDLLGQMPCQIEDTQQRLPDGSLRAWEIGGRPYRTYTGCVSNPHWRTVMKAIELGVDGIMALHNFEYLCSCEYCARHLQPRLGRVFSADELNALFGSSALEEVESVTSLEACGEALKRRFRLELLREGHQQRDGRVHFAIPSVIVYGMCVIFLD